MALKKVDVSTLDLSRPTGRKPRFDDNDVAYAVETLKSGAAVTDGEAYDTYQRARTVAVTLQRRVAKVWPHHTHIYVQRRDDGQREWYLVPANPVQAAPSPTQQPADQPQPAAVANDDYF